MQVIRGQSIQNIRRVVLCPNNVTLALTRVLYLLPCLDVTEERIVGVEMFVAGVLETLLQALVALVVFEYEDTDDKEGRGTLAIEEDDVSLSVLGDFMTEFGVLRER